MNYILPFLAVALGALFVLIGKSTIRKQLPLLLSFSGAFLLATTITAVFPEVFVHGNGHISYWVLAGIMVQIALENLTKGAEHGHIHAHGNSSLPWALVIGLSLHAFIEGFPIAQHQELLWAVAIHKLPIAMLLVAALWQTKSSMIRKFSILIVFGLMTPLGSFCNVTIPELQPYALNITALVAGVMLHISTTILFESAENHKFNLPKVLVILFGLGLAALLH
jgi:zinc transporter ZupT